MQKGNVWTAKGYVNLLARLHIYSGDDDNDDDDDVEQQPTLALMQPIATRGSTVRIGDVNDELLSRMAFV